MIITKHQLAENILNYLQHKTSLSELVDWSKNAHMEGEIEVEDPEVVLDILARLGLADVKEFGLIWEDCVDIMLKLGYVLRIDAGLVA